jgi:class 3 adenylate cyclase
MVDSIPVGTVMFVDVVNYEHLSASMSAEQLFCVLNNLFSELEAVTDKHKLTRAEHAGDRLMLIATPENYEGDKAHAEACAAAAIDMLEITRKVRASQPEARRLALAVGMQSGSLYSCAAISADDASSVVRPKFYFGETVNAAHDLEVSGRAMTINMGAATWELLQETYKFEKIGKDDAPGYLLVHAVCDWEAALKSDPSPVISGSYDDHQDLSRRPSRPVSQKPMLPPSEGETTDTSVDALGSRAKLVPSTFAGNFAMRRRMAMSGNGSSSDNRSSPTRAGGRHRRMLELQLRQETEKCASLNLKAARLEGEVDAMRQQCDDMQKKLDSTLAELTQARQTARAHTHTHSAAGGLRTGDSEAVAALEALRVDFIRLETEKKELEQRLKAEPAKQGTSWQAASAASNLAGSPPKHPAQGSGALNVPGESLVIQNVLDVASATQQQLQAEIHALRNVRSELEEHLRAVQANNEELRSQRNALIQRVDELERENSILRDRIVAARSQTVGAEGDGAFRAVSPQLPPRPEYHVTNSNNAYSQSNAALRYSHSSVECSISDEPAISGMAAAAVASPPPNVTPTSRSDVLQDIRADMRLLLHRAASPPVVVHSPGSGASPYMNMQGGHTQYLHAHSTAVPIYSPPMPPMPAGRISPSYGVLGAHKSPGSHAYGSSDHSLGTLTEGNRGSVHTSPEPRLIIRDQNAHNVNVPLERLAVPLERLCNVLAVWNVYSDGYVCLLLVHAW